MKIPVAFLNGSFLRGGGERDLLELLRHLDRDRFDLHMFYIHRKGDLLADYERTGVPLIPLGFDSLKSMAALRAIPRARAYLRDKGVRVLHGFGVYGSLYAAAIARGVNGLSLISYEFTSGRSRGLRQHLFQPWYYRHSAAIVCNSDAVIRAVAARPGVSPDRLVKIYNGVDVGRYTTASPVPIEDLPDDVPAVGVVGRLHPVKGHRYIIEAWPRVLESFPAARLVLIGPDKPEWKDGLQETIARLGIGHRVLFLGVRPDVPGLLPRFDLVAVPSLAEGFANAVIEAGAAGKVVVATSVGGNPEAVVEGKTGFLVPPADAGALAGAIVTLLSNRVMREGMGAAGRERVSRNFTLEKMVTAYEELYESVAQPRRRKPSTGLRARLYRGYMGARARTLRSYLDEIEKSQWLDRNTLAELQLSRLRETLVQAGKDVPYYRDLFRQHRFDPAGIGSLDDLKQLPPLERETLTADFDTLRSAHARGRVTTRATGGSTGRPLRFDVDEHDTATRSAHIYRNLRWLGWDLGRRAAFVWGSDIDAREHTGLAGTARDLFAGVLWLDAFRLSEDRLDVCLDRIDRFDPDVVIGYPSSLHLLAQRALARGGGPALRGIQTSAEMLAPGVREDLQKAFGCRVLDRYGCREAGVIAHECPQGRYHVNTEAVVLEVENGEILVTTLNNRAMPLIRYRNEDLAAVADDPCSCGRGLPLVGGIRGRLSDVIRSPRGRLIHGEFFTHLFYDVPGVRRFQVRQTSPEVLQVLVVSDDSFTPAHRKRLEEAIRDHGDPAFRVDWESVAEIPSGPSGKFRFTISDIA